MISNSTENARSSHSTLLVGLKGAELGRGRNWNSDAGLRGDELGKRASPSLPLKGVLRYAKRTEGFMP
ncbi:hypothetical protein MC885_014592 [Smutsia gigantea]|nr:hypothetical protein MC885_014592 [Smutsia gigantea]